MRKLPNGQLSFTPRAVHLRSKRRREHLQFLEDKRHLGEPVVRLDDGYEERVYLESVIERARQGKLPYDAYCDPWDIAPEEDLVPDARLIPEHFDPIPPKVPKSVRAIYKADYQRRLAKLKPVPPMPSTPAEWQEVWLLIVRVCSLEPGENT
jgi:hypothetical protein